MLAIGMPGLPELLIIGFIMLLLFGNRLPSLMRSLGRGVVEFKQGLHGVDDDFGRFLAAATDDPSEDGARLTRVSAGAKLKGAGRAVFMNRNLLTEWDCAKQAAAFDLREARALPGEIRRARVTDAAGLGLFGELV